MGDVAGSLEDDSHAAAPPHSGSSRRGPTSPHSFTGRHRQHWLMALGGPVLSVVAIAVGVLIVVHAVQATDLPLGRGTGTFTWPNDGSGEGGSSQGFNGTAGRFQVSDHRGRLHPVLRLCGHNRHTSTHRRIHGRGSRWEGRDSARYVRRGAVSPVKTATRRWVPATNVRPLRAEVGNA
jgi:hypothetical protein